MQINGDYFNPVYWHIKKALNDPGIRFIYVMGGSSASKTYSIVQNLVFDTYENGYSTMVLRKNSTEIDDSVYRDFKTILKPFQNSPFIIQQKNIKYGTNAAIRFKGLDYSEKVKGIASFQRVYMNEITGFDHNDFKEVRRRLRGKSGQQIICDWNPISSNHWMKEEVIDREEWIDQPSKIEGIKYSQLDEQSYVKKNSTGNAVLIKTTYRDNYWIMGHPVKSNVGFKDIHTLQEFEDMKRNNPDDYKVYGLGEWGIISDRLIFTNWTEVDEKPEGFSQVPSGMDFGMSPDPAVMIDCYIGNYLGRKCLYLEEAIWDNNLVNVDVGENPLQNSIEAELKRIGFDKNQLIVADSAEKKSVQELRNVGYSVHLAIKGPGSINSGIKIMKSYFILINKKSVNLIREFKNYKKKIDKNGTILPEPIDKDNHGIDAVRYVALQKDRLW